MKELANANHKNPPFEPYLVASRSSQPWLPQTDDHIYAIATWKALSKQAKRDFLPREVRIQSSRLYHMRFLVASFLCRAFDPSGCLRPQLPHLGAVLSLAIAEHIGIASPYHRVVNQKLQERARRRLVDEHFTPNFSMNLAPHVGES